MNISLSAATSKKKKPKTAKLGFGLNARGGNVLGGDDDDDDDDKDSDQQDDDNNTAPDARAVVNQALRKEQNALRQRAQKELQQAAMAAGNEDNIYDYDAAYESFQPNNKDNDGSLSPSAPAVIHSRIGNRKPCFTRIDFIRWIRSSFD